MCDFWSLDWRFGVSQVLLSTLAPLSRCSCHSTLLSGLLLYSIKACHKPLHFCVKIFYAESSTFKAEISFVFPIPMMPAWPHLYPKWLPSFQYYLSLVYLWKLWQCFPVPCTRGGCTLCHLKPDTEELCWRIPFHTYWPNQSLPSLPSCKCEINIKRSVFIGIQILSYSGLVARGSGHDVQKVEGQIKRKEIPEHHMIQTTLSCADSPSHKWWNRHGYWHFQWQLWE